MPIHLHHGPASHKKFQKLIDLVCAHEALRPDYLIIVPNKSSIPQHKAAILDYATGRLGDDAQNRTVAQSPSRNVVLLGQTILTFEDFLTKLIKLNHHRVHIADQEFSHYLLYLLIQTKYPSLFKNPLERLKTIGEIYNFFIQIKSCGVDSEKARSIFKDKIENEQIFALFDDYQTELKKHFYYDTGDLYLSTLNLIKTGKLTLPGKAYTLYFSQIYPLKPGQREIIRQLGNGFPELNIHIFYDEHFTQEHNLLDQAYNDLGAMADESIHYEKEATKEHAILQLKNPYHEIQFIVGQIKEKIKQGTKPQALAIIIPDHQYIHPLLQSLQKNKIPYSLQLSQPITEFIENSASRQVAKSQSRSLIQLMRDQNNEHAAQKLRAESKLESTLQNLEFLETLFEEMIKKISPEQKELFNRELCNSLTTDANTFSEQLIITNLNHALSVTDRELFFLGFHFENFAKAPESSIYSPYLYTKKEFVELLDSPSLRLKTAIEKIKQLLNLASTITLTKPEYDFSEKPTTKIDLGPNHKIFEQTIDDRRQTLDDRQLELRQSPDYFKTKKRKFSVSELQSYIDCPYTYYARYHLKLGSKEKDDIDPSGDIKGSFVHHILQRLIKENEADYLEGLEYESFRKKIFKKLSQIVQEELDHTKDFDKFNQKVVEYYAYRVYKTILEMINHEAENYKSGKKKTTPKHYEWPFGSDSKNSFEIKTDHSTITLTGRIDRIDISRSEQNFSVIDYKTGNIPPVSDLKTGKSIQLPLYLMAVKKLLYPDYQPAGAYFYALKENEIKGFTINPSVDRELMHKRSQVSLESWQEIEEVVLTKVNDSIKGIYNADFDPKPADQKMCQFCDYRRICGYHATDNWTKKSHRNPKKSLCNSLSGNRQNDRTHTKVSPLSLWQKHSVVQYPSLHVHRKGQSRDEWAYT